MYFIKSPLGSESTDKFGTKPANTADQSILPFHQRLMITPKKQITIAATESLMIFSKNLTPLPPTAYIATIAAASANRTAVIATSTPIDGASVEAEKFCVIAATPSANCGIANTKHANSEPNAHP